MATKKLPKSPPVEKVVPKSPSSDNVVVDKNTKIMNGVNIWASFYRANPHRFVKDYLGIELRLFQKILIYMMNISTHFIYLAARG